MDLALPTDPGRLTLGRFLEDVAARHGDRTAIRFEGRSVTYAEVEADARRLARALVGAGVVKGARVALWMGNRPEWIRCAFAVGLVGGVLVPVNTFATPAERDHILRHSDASLLLMQPRLARHEFADGLLTDHPRLAEGWPGRLRDPDFPNLRRLFCLDIPAARGALQTWDQLLDLGDDVPDELVRAIGDEVEPSDDGMIIYTSGTTAKPKGVLHSQRAPVIQAWRFADLLRLDENDRVWSIYPFFWTAGIAMSIGATFAAGGTLILQEIFEPGQALDLLEGERATSAHAWPHQHKAIAEHPSAAGRNLSSLTKINFTSPLAPLAGLTEDRYSEGASYGLSETFTLSSMLYVDAPAELRKSSSGKPLPGMQIRIVDPESGERLPTGKQGEIAVKGATFMRGYYKVEPELFLDEDGFFHTQDGGSLDDEGYLHWSGRLSNIIKTGGANVSPVEIEATLNAFPDLKLGVPVAVPHPTLGEAIILCAVKTDGAATDEAAVRAWLKGRLAAYKIPKRVLFFEAGELSYTSNQKVQVDPLRKIALERLIAEGAEIDGHRYTAGDGL